MRKNRRMAPKENEAIEIEKNSQRPLTCVQSSSYGGLLGLSWDGTGFCYFFEKFHDSQPLAARAKSFFVPRGTTRPAANLQGVTVHPANLALESRRPIFQNPERRKRIALRWNGVVSVPSETTSAWS